ncbi:DUF559 domain-containing protein [Nocardioides acrostichi]|uniref:DUF559 domain-containing protein n=1 Tax=Nocardioides acrostichi TaxID=2784339 RepID=A0A930V172_9ACTN|nr:DUF559 domain-containing protein [Nocardioides acrostichi]MBF4161344.1 DUF559 domain-containing protein [Nocardioides acrostichi]
MDDETLTPARALAELGGVATRARLVEVCGRRAVDEGLRQGEVVAVARGVYAQAGVTSSLTAAAAVGGTVSHRSAALLHGWGVLTEPDPPEVTVRRNRRVVSTGGVTLHRSDLAPDDTADGATRPDRTLADCLRLPDEREALAVADSALRSGVSRPHLLAIARDLRGPGSQRARWVAQRATRFADNPFESALRHACLRVPGLRVVAQVDVRDPHWLGRPDLVDERLRLVLEADSFAWHGDRAALDRDCIRYNAFVAAGWLVLRFSWEQVVLHPSSVTATVRAVVQRRTQRPCQTCGAA